MVSYAAGAYYAMMEGVRAMLNTKDISRKS